MVRQSEPTQQQIRNYLWRVVEVAVLLVFVALVAWIFGLAMGYILPFVIGWIFAVLLIPAVRRLEIVGVKRTAAVITVMVSSVVIVIALTGAAVIAIAREATMLSANSSLYFHEMNTWISNKVALGRVFYSELPPSIADKTQSEMVSLLASVEKWIQSFITGLITSVTHLPETLFIVVIALITTFFVLDKRERMKQRFLASLPPGWSEKIQVVIETTSKAFVGTIRVQIILMVMSAVLGVIGMWVLGFPYAVILGILFGISGIIPMLGSAILTVPWAIGALAVGDISTAIKLIALQIVVSVIRHMIEPKILAESVGLDTLSTLFALYVGMKAIGILGLFLGPIILIAVKSLLSNHLFVGFLPNVEVDHPDDTHDPPDNPPDNPPQNTELELSQAVRGNL